MGPLPGPTRPRGAWAPAGAPLDVHRFSVATRSTADANRNPKPEKLDPSGYLKAIWPDFWGMCFWALARSRGPGRPPVPARAQKLIPPRIRPDCLQVPGGMQLFRLGVPVWAASAVELVATEDGSTTGPKRPGPPAQAVWDLCLAHPRCHYWRHRPKVETQS